MNYAMFIYLEDSKLSLLVSHSTAVSTAQRQFEKSASYLRFRRNIVEYM